MELRKYIKRNNNYWCMDKFVYQLLGATTAILLMEYISYADENETKEIKVKRKLIKAYTGIDKNGQFKSDKKLVKLHLIEILPKKKFTKKAIRIKRRNIKQFFKDPILYVEGVLKTGYTVPHAGVPKRGPDNDTAATVPKRGQVKYIYNYNILSFFNTSFNIINAFRIKLQTYCSLNLDKPTTIDKPIKFKYPEIIVKPKTIIPQPAIPLYSSYNIQPIDYSTYQLLVDAGATNHGVTTKSYSTALDLIHQLLTNKCKNPYRKALAQTDDKATRKYLDKKWTPDEIIETFKIYLKLNGSQYRTVAGFIICDYCGTGIYSPLVKTHMQPNKQEQKFNGTAKQLQDFVIKKTGKPKQFSAGLFIKTGALIDEVQEVYAGNPNLLPPEDNLSYHFLKFLDKKIDTESFKIPYMCSENFMFQFVDEASGNKQIVKKSNIRRY